MGERPDYRELCIKKDAQIKRLKVYLKDKGQKKREADDLYRVTKDKLKVANRMVNDLKTQNRRYRKMMAEG